MFVLASCIYHIFCNRSFGSSCIYIYTVVSDNSGTCVRRFLPYTMETMFLRIVHWEKFLASNVELGRELLHWRQPVTVDHPSQMLPVTVIEGGWTTDMFAEDCDTLIQPFTTPLDPVERMKPNSCITA